MLLVVMAAAPGPEFLKKKLSVFLSAAEYFKQWFIWDCPPACAEQHDRRDDDGDPFRPCTLPRTLNRSVLQGCLASGCVWWMCPYSVHKMYVLLSGWDLNQKQSASNFIGLRNSLKAHAGVSMENTGKGRKHKGHGWKHTAQMLPQVKQWRLLPSTTLGTWPSISGPCGLKPRCRWLPLLCTNIMGVTHSAEQMPKSNQ